MSHSRTALTTADRVAGCSRELKFSSLNKSARSIVLQHMRDIHNVET